jgi:hypothetical protein
LVPGKVGTDGAAKLGGGVLELVQGRIEFAQ